MNSSKVLWAGYLMEYILFILWFLKLLVGNGYPTFLLMMVQLRSRESIMAALFRKDEIKPAISIKFNFPLDLPGTYSGPDKYSTLANY